MKKIVLVLLSITALQLWAANEISIVPDATVHNGASAGDPAGFIDGNGKLDVSGMASGSLLVFNVVMTNLDFTLAGYEFQIDYPVNLTMLSETPADWEAGTGAVYKGEGYTGTGSIQWLPAESDGTRNAITVDNANGKFRVGMLYTSAVDRPVGTGGGGDVAIGTISFEWNHNDQASCTSNEESIRIVITNADPEFVANADIFADDTATRKIVGTANVDVKFGDPSAKLRADASDSNGRTPADLIPAARCTLFGSSDAGCTSYHDWSVDPAFTQVFDYNCDGAVTPADLMGNARLTLGIANRTQFKNQDYYTVKSLKGQLKVSYNKQQGCMSYVAFSYSDMAFDAPQISEKAKMEGWNLLYDLGSDTMSYAVFNPSLTASEIPEVTLNYRSKSAGRLAVVDTMVQALDYSFPNVKPNVEDYDLAPEKIKPDVTKGN